MSADTLTQAKMAADKSMATFPIAYGCTKADADTIGAWWGDHLPDGEHIFKYEAFIQPTEFLLSRGGVVLGSMYASGPVGRMNPDEAIFVITSREK